MKIFQKSKCQKNYKFDQNRTKVDQKKLNNMAAVAATTADIADAALELINVDYEVLPHVIDVDDAMKDGAPILHEEMVASGIEIDGPTNIAKFVEFNLGDTKKGFEEYLEEVINFSGIGDYIYLPIKTYSTGMASRLNFSILTAFDFECLALDEGLGAGDNDFTEKAQKRANEFIDKAGTLIFASHSDELLKRFCKRGLVFDKGSIVFDGLLDKALNFYYGK